MITVKSHSTPVDIFDPLAAYESLSSSFGSVGTVLLESGSGPARDVRSSVICFAPILTLRISRLTATIGGEHDVVASVAEALSLQGFAVAENSIDMTDRSQLWHLLRVVKAQFACEEHDAGSFSFGFFACLGYDVIRSVETLPEIVERRENSEDAVFIIHSAHISLDKNNQAKLTVHFSDGYFSQPDQEAINNAINATASAEIPAAPPLELIETTIEKKDYLTRVERALFNVSIGDIYQVQIGHEVRVASSIAPIDIYKRLRFRNPSPYMYLCDVGETQLIGASPEAFLRCENGIVSERPIAGTVRHSDDDQENDALMNQLATDEKERAEHVMLVDLARNDLARVSVPGTVEVDELMIIEQYSHVNHMVSNVVGKLRPGDDEFDVLRATFPAGTMTGAPKVRAMEIIEELENSPRGYYAGSIGLFDFGGYINSALCIRTVFGHDNTFTMRASGGVVADSTPEGEWNETWSKIAAPFWAVTGTEVDDAGLRS